MASQTEIEDEIYARRLQSEEMQLARSSSQTSNQDADVARRLERQLSAQPPIQNSATFALQPGQAMYVKLHHCATNRQIGDTLVAHFLPGDDMLFETTSQTPTRYLRVKESGSVEFSIVRDSATLFKTEPSSGKSVFLVSKPFIARTNSRGGRGWYLCMSSNGQVYANGPRDASAEWMLISTTFANNTVAATQSTPVNIPPPPPLPSVTATSVTPFPGLDAGKDELVKFFATSAGVQFLQQADYTTAYQLYQTNHKLFVKLLHRPDWPYTATKVTDYAASMETIPFDRNVLDNFVSRAHLKAFFEQGYAILPQLLSSEKVANALRIVNYWQFKYAQQTHLLHGNGVKKVISPSGMEYMGDILQDHDILGLYYTSLLPHVLQGLMGENEIVHPKTASRIISTYPSFSFTDSSVFEGNQWTIDGFTAAGGHSPYNILVGIALTDIDDINQGNFCVHPGSHMILLDEYRRKVQQKSTLFSDNPKQVQKPDLGQPVQLRLKAGDAFLCTQRLAYLHAMNMGSQPTTIVYYRISHIDHAVMKDPALQSMWLEYKYASTYLDDENAGICMNEDTLDAYDINVVHDTHNEVHPISPPANTNHDLLDLSHPATPVVPAAAVSAVPISSQHTSTSGSAHATTHGVAVVAPPYGEERTRNVADDDDDEDAPLLQQASIVPTRNTVGDVEMQPLVHRQ